MTNKWTFIFPSLHRYFPKVALLKNEIDLENKKKNVYVIDYSILDTFFNKIITQIKFDIKIIADTKYIFDIDDENIKVTYLSSQCNAINIINISYNNTNNISVKEFIEMTNYCNSLTLNMNKKYIRSNRKVITSEYGEIIDTKIYKLYDKHYVLCYKFDFDDNYYYDYTQYKKIYLVYKMIYMDEHVDIIYINGNEMYMLNRVSNVNNICDNANISYEILKTNMDDMYKFHVYQDNKFNIIERYAYNIKI